MYFDQDKAATQGTNDAWADIEPRKDIFKNLSAQQSYIDAYTKALKDIDDYYMQQKAEAQ